MSETITAAQGSGGVETERLIEEVFRAELGNAMLARAEDAAVFSLSGRVAYSTDSFVVTPLAFRGGDIGKLAVCGTVNDLCMMGAQPKYLSAGFILEEGLSYDTLRAVVRSFGETARAAGVQVAAADTKVVGTGGGMYINTSGLGLIPDGRDVRADACRAGDRLLVSGNLGDHHACILSHRMGIENEIQSDVKPLVQPVEALFRAGVRVRAMRDITRGGLGTVLNELARASGCGCEVEERALPMAKETRALAQILGLDPFYMGNEGTFLAVVAPEDGARALEVLREFGNAQCIGAFHEQARVTVRGELGGERILPPLYGEGLPRIC